MPMHYRMSTTLTPHALAAAPDSRASRAPVSDRPSAAERAAAFEFLTKLAAELSKGPLNLPCFPDIVPRVRRALADPRSTPDKIVTVVGAEPRLAARILQIANSAIFNASGPPITDLRQAVTRLGSQLVQSVTMAFAVQQMKADPVLKRMGEPLAQLWERSLMVASMAQLLARRSRVAPEEAFLAGLLHGIGRFYILVRASDRLAGGRAEDALAEQVADWHPSIGQAVLERWGFGGALPEAVGAQTDHARRRRREADLTDVLVAAVALVDARAGGPEVLARYPSIPSVATLGLTAEDLGSILRHSEVTLATVRDTLGY
jgi:HD-like signal output (HDOD) protein